MRAWNRAKLLWGYLSRQSKLSALPVEYIVETTHGKKTATTEAVGCIIDRGQEAETEILA